MVSQPFDICQRQAHFFVCFFSFAWVGGWVKSATAVEFFILFRRRAKSDVK